MNNKKGNALPTIILLICVFAILIPSIVSYISNEAKWTVKEKRRTTAFHVAEAGLDRGTWKMNESSANWNTIVGGGTIAGYNNDVIYTDVSGGSYKIKIEKIDATSISITCNSKDSAEKEFRALKAIYTKGAIVSPLMAPSYAAGGNFTVWWGPIYSLGDLTVSGASDRIYPRKMARGKVDPRDIDPGPVNIDPDVNKEWWSYNSYPVPDAPTPDLAWYEAQSHIAPNEYYAGATTFGAVVDVTPKIRWCNAGATIGTNGTHMQGWLFVMGNCSITAKGDSTAGAYAAMPPTNAWQEYVKDSPEHTGPGLVPDSAAQNEYPGDGGYHTTKSFTFYTTLGGAPKKYVAFKGFVYCTGTFSGGANTIIHGAIIVAGGGGFGGGGADLFYDDTLTVRFSTSASGSETRWEEVTPTPF